MTDRAVPKTPLLPCQEWLATLPRHYIAAAVLVTDPDGRVLLLEPTYRDGHLLPGGAVDAGKDPRSAAARELAEETGLRLPGEAVLLDVDWRAADPAVDGGRAAPVLQFIFDGGTIPADTDLVLDDESRSWRWATLAEAAVLQGPAGHARLVRAVEARRQGATGYGVSTRGAVLTSPATAPPTTDAGDNRGGASPLPQRPLWERDFTLLFAGRAASTTGTTVSAVALPLVAITVLNASAFQAALLVTAGQLPVLLLALPVGALVDRRRAKRPVMIGADVVCASWLATVPLAASAGALSLPHLYAVAFVLAAGGLVFDAAAHAYTPDLLGPDRLLRGNAAFSTASSATDIAGAPLAAALIMLVGAAAAVGADVAGYLASALALLAVRHREPPPAPTAARARLRTEIAAGLRFVADDPVLRAVTTANAVAWLLVAVTGAVRMVYLVRDLHWTPAAIGAAMACGGAGGLVGGLAATRLPGSEPDRW